MKKNRFIVKIKGLNQERALNSISQKIKIFNIKRENQNTCQLEVEYSNKKQLLTFLKEENFEVLEVSAQGLKWKLKNFLTCYGLIIGIVCCAIFYTAQYSFVWRIDVVGGNASIEKEVKNHVEKQLTSRRKSKINTKNIEKKLIEYFDEVSSASVAIVGQSLIINISQSILPEEMQQNSKAIISDFDGLITDIKLIQGTLAVDVGDIVKKGDILVYPYIIDSQGEQRETSPKAEVWADVWLNGNEVHYDYYITTQRTGNSMTVSEVYLYDLLIYSSANHCNYEDYESEQSQDYLNKNNILPFVLKKTTYFELETKQYFQEFSLVKEEIIQKAREKALIFLQENEIIKEENYTIREGGGIHEVNYLLTVNRNIGG